MSTYRYTVQKFWKLWNDFMYEVSVSLMSLAMAVQQLCDSALSRSIGEETQFFRESWSLQQYWKSVHWILFYISCIQIMVFWHVTSCSLVYSTDVSKDPTIPYSRQTMSVVGSCEKLVHINQVHEITSQKAVTLRTSHCIQLNPIVVFYNRMILMSRNSIIVLIYHQHKLLDHIFFDIRFNVSLPCIYTTDFFLKDFQP